MKYPVAGLFIVLIYLFTNSATAQLCQGSLGPAILHRTFGSGSNPGGPLAASSTNYTYVANDCPNDGFYTVRNSSNACYGSTWHTLSSDHSGEPGGYFMLVNASFTPGDFYVDTVRGICSGTTFEFAAWVINMLRPGACSPPILPNLTFRIERTDGALIQSYNTGDIGSTSSPQWQQIGFFFTTPPGVTDVIVRITNNASGGCGNDLALDDITFRPCGPLLNSSIIGEPGRSISFCEGPLQQYMFSCAVSAGFTNPLFQWQQSINGGPYTDLPGANATSMSVTFLPNSPPAVHSFRLVAAEAGNMANASCRIASEPLVVTIHANPDPQPSSNSPVCAGNTLSLATTGVTRYAWTGPNGFAATIFNPDIPDVTLAATGRYYVEVTSTAGCRGIDSTDVIVNPSPVATISPAGTTICEGDIVALFGGGGNSYIWSPATGLSSAAISNPVASPTQTTDYRLIVSTAEGCTDTAYSLITVQQAPRANAGPDKITVVGIPVQLDGQVTGDNITYTWSPVIHLDDASLLKPQVSAPAGTYTYELAVSSSCGISSDSVKVIVYNDLFIPTAFTPNNDGRNDTWMIPALSAYKEFETRVYNRYGQLIYFTNSTGSGWDGTFKGEPQPGGVYVYMVKTGSGSSERVYKGTFVLIR